jgi:predicted dehydrogenase
MAETRSLVSTGALGTIMHSDANFGHDKLVGVPAINWRSSPNDVLAAGMVAMGVHLTDAFIDRSGPFEEVFASVTSRATFPDNGDVDSAHLRFRSQPTAQTNVILMTPPRICRRQSEFLLSID